MASPHPTTRLTAALVLGAMAGSPSASAQTDALRAKLELFFVLAPADSVHTLHCGETGGLELAVSRDGSGPTRTLSAQANPQAALRLCEEAAQVGIATGTLVAGEPMPDPASPLPSDRPPRTASGDADDDSDADASAPRTPSSRSVQKQNRLSYVVTQSAYGFLTYGPAFIHAFDLDGRVAGAVSLFSLTGAIAGHTYYALPRNFEDAHMTGLNYGAVSSAALSYSLPFLVMGENGDPGRVGSALLLGAYPLGIWSGYWFGDGLKDNPGRAGLAPTFAYTGALLMAFATPIALPESGGPLIRRRIYLGAMIAAGVGGHAASPFYRKDETIPTGIPLGLVSHTALGFGLASAVLVNFDSDDFPLRGAFSILTAGTAAGFAEGLWFFRESRDDYDRSFFSLLGMAGGLALSAGILTLSDPAEDGVWAAGLYGGALAGYAGTYALLKPKPERQGRLSSEKTIKAVEVNPIPVPEPVRLADGTLGSRFRVPGLTVRF